MRPVLPYPVDAGIDWTLMTRELRNPFASGVLIAAVIVGPALLCWHLHGLWNPDGEYAYGWAVPLLAACLWKFRWDDRPARSAPLEVAMVAAVALALMTLPALWLQEAAPERGICAWSYAMGCLGVSLAIVAMWGGGAWVRWFVFPFAFILTAVPWPHGPEMLVSNSMMHGMAGVTSEILCLIGIPSVQVGNLVHIETGVIDIDEACSGIRSLQAMVMLSLFLGELFRLRTGRRMALIGVGLLLTLLANILRTVTLSWIAFHQGMSAIDRYHDAAGLGVLLLSLGGALWVASRLAPTRGAGPQRGVGRIALRVPVGICVAVVGWFVFEEMAVEAWYRAHETQWQGWSWAVQWPMERADFHAIEIPPRSLRLLMCDESHAAGWKEADGAAWSVYWLRWNPGNLSAEVAKVHRPDVCLNAEGAIMQDDMGVQMESIGRMRIPFHSYTFRLGEKTVYVFFALYEEGPGEQATAAGVPQFEGVDMLQRALEGRRRTGLQSLEVALSGYGTERDAQTAFNARVVNLVKTR
jgi:exosortase